MRADTFTESRDGPPPAGPMTPCQARGLLSFRRSAGAGRARDAQIALVVARSCTTRAEVRTELWMKKESEQIEHYQLMATGLASASVRRSARRRLDRRRRRRDWKRMESTPIALKRATVACYVLVSGKAIFGDGACSCLHAVGRRRHASCLASFRAAGLTERVGRVPDRRVLPRRGRRAVAKRCRTPTPSSTITTAISASPSCC